MFEQSSRYTNCENAELNLADGNIVKYKRRRFLPQSEKMSIIQEVRMVSGDRLDLISTKLFGDPEQFWRLCDSNDAMEPTELVEPGKILKVGTLW